MIEQYGSVPFAHIAINHSHLQQSVPRGFPLFKHCEWLVVNCNVGKRAPLNNTGLGLLRFLKRDENYKSEQIH